MSALQSSKLIKYIHNDIDYSELWNFRSHVLSLPCRNFRFHSQRNVVLLPNTNYDNLVDKLMEIKAL